MAHRTATILTDFDWGSLFASDGGGRGKLWTICGMGRGGGEGDKVSTAIQFRGRDYVPGVSVLSSCLKEQA